MYCVVQQTNNEALLHTAARTGQKQACEILLACGANVDAVTLVCCPHSPAHPGAHPLLVFAGGEMDTIAFRSGLRFHEPCYPTAQCVSKHKQK